ncbi:hypothetical protein U472_03225 [Orenia metallireducens]|uniref:Peptidoglycan binding-like domain-containing protein n=1 Tax=Orenia metallireducens TaxID=1413210 RepID=A0A1C0AB24_9FIRM|nr:peptidoglycan-binding protein [Orenia metallireducens]OCL27579.1 hypothetical protein U472_03225 [Orenia metallireducens]
MTFKNKATKSKFNLILLIIVLIFTVTSNIYAHSGRTDSNGGHYVRSKGTGYPVGSYHYHNSGYSNNSTNISSLLKDNEPTNSNNYKQQLLKIDYYKALKFYILNYTNDEVELLQKALNQLGYNCGEIDGFIGKRTISSVVKFQEKNELQVDGMAGKQVKEVLASLSNLYKESINSNNINSKNAVN